MQAPFSSYLTSIESGLRALLELLRREYEYVSILSSDSVGFAVRISRHQRSVSCKTLTTERGSVIRVSKNGLYGEYSFNRFDPHHPELTADLAIHDLNEQLAFLQELECTPYETSMIEDESASLSVEMETEELPETTEIGELIARLTAICNDHIRAYPELIDCQLSAQSTHISKLFLTENRNLRQSYVYSEGTAVAIASRGGKNRISYSGISDRCGPELFQKLNVSADSASQTAVSLLDAEPVTPGEYDIITSPEVTGLIAHEAFGHGVEMDMFVKDRALGAYYIDKRVGSDLVTMHEGAICAKNVTSYAFDDEGTLAGDVIEIDHGILKTGICDVLSALRLGIKPTGNGKRENFEHKAYTRMTNTVFDSGSNTLDEMIASIDHGYLLCGMESGMEDPKHWGIQCIIERGYEILHGSLTGRIIAPVILTGYVPDLLNSISMLSNDREISGNGACGKGYKEWVKVADGGPYMKAKARLG